MLILNLIVNDVFNLLIHHQVCFNWSAYFLVICVDFHYLSIPQQIICQKLFSMLKFDGELEKTNLRQLRVFKPLADHYLFETWLVM